MKKIVMIGDFAIDRAVYVQATRLCPEAPVPVVIPQKETASAGMAGNVLANLQSLSGHSDDSFIIFSPDCKNEKLRFVDVSTGYIMLRVDDDCPKDEEPPFNPEEAFEKITGPLKISLQDISAIVLSDYAKGFLNQKNISEVASFARKNNIPTFLDTKLVLGDWSRDVFCVKINQKEYEYNLSSGFKYPEQYCQNLVVTRASAGTQVFSNNFVYNVPVQKVNVSDVCGAGDTMLAALVLKYVEEPDLLKAVLFANAAASFAVTKCGVYSVTSADMQGLGIIL